MSLDLLEVINAIVTFMNAKCAPSLLVQMVSEIIRETLKTMELPDVLLITGTRLLIKKYSMISFPLHA